LTTTDQEKEVRVLRTLIEKIHYYAGLIQADDDEFNVAQFAEALHQHIAKELFTVSDLEYVVALASEPL
jgi:hypothetical protein